MHSDFGGVGGETGPENGKANPPTQPRRGGQAEGLCFHPTRVPLALEENFFFFSPQQQVAGGEMGVRPPGFFLLPAEPAEPDEGKSSPELPLRGVWPGFKLPTLRSCPSRRGRRPSLRAPPAPRLPISPPGWENCCSLCLPIADGTPPPPGSPPLGAVATPCAPHPSTHPQLPT